MFESNRSRNRQVAQAPTQESGKPEGYTGILPVWAPLLVMLAVIITGIVLALDNKQVPTSYFVLFAIASIVLAMLVEARALFLTIASLPLYFFIGALLIGSLIVPESASNAGRKTKIITAIYPAIENYLWLIIPFVIAAIIGWLRWMIYREALQRQQVREYHERLRRSSADSANREATRRAHGYELASSPAGRHERDPYSSQSTYRVRDLREAQEERKNRDEEPVRLRRARHYLDD